MSIMGTYHVTSVGISLATLTMRVGSFIALVAGIFVAIPPVRIRGAQIKIQRAAIVTITLNGRALVDP